MVAADACAVFVDLSDSTGSALPALAVLAPPNQARLVASLRNALAPEHGDASTSSTSLSTLFRGTGTRLARSSSLERLARKRAYLAWAHQRITGAEAGCMAAGAVGWHW
jgi:hypothetical protein